MIRYKLTDDITLEITDVGRDMDLALMHATGYDPALPLWMATTADKWATLYGHEEVDIPPISTDTATARRFVERLRGDDRIDRVDVDRRFVDEQYISIIEAKSGATTTATHRTFAGAVAWAALAFFAEGLADAPEPTVSSEWLEEQAKFLASSADEVRNTLRQINELRSQPTPETGRTLHDVIMNIAAPTDTEALLERLSEAMPPFVSVSGGASTPSLPTDPASEILPGLPSRPFSQRRLDMAAAIATIRTTRAAIFAALTADIGDEATAERLTGVVMRALEGNGDE